MHGAFFRRFRGPHVHHLLPPYFNSLEFPPIAPRPDEPNPTWEVALLFSAQGEWTESEYLSLNASRLVELVDGRLEVLPAPTYSHQLLVQFFHQQLNAFVEQPSLGHVLFAPLPVFLRHATYREPDVVFVTHERRLRHENYPHGADLVVEVVSEGEKSRQRDLVDKRADYAAAGIPEYWIVDPLERTVSVLVLQGEAYREAGVFKPGNTAASVLLPGFSLDVAALFTAGDVSPEPPQG